MIAATTRPTTREPVAGHVQPGDFRHRAACRSVDPEIFFPAPVAGAEFEMQVAVAKAVCAGCPVLSECLVWAVAHQPDGIAGGMTEHERHAERALRRAGRVSAVVVRRPAGGSRPEVAAAGRAAIAAGLSPQEAAGVFEVSPRTAHRWAHAVHTGAPDTSSGTSGGSGEGESASAATVALSRVSHNTALQGARAAEGHRG